MPGKNTLKIYAPGHYYHVYNRGVAKQTIFCDAEDKKKFLQILSRHLDPANKSTRYDGVIYEKFTTLELLSYCLMGNHYHLLFYLGDNDQELKKLMQSVGTSYSMYFNRKYKRVGPVFQGVFKASIILEESYLLHITRYIHMNPRRYETYYYSSLKYFLGEQPPAWIKPSRILESFKDTDYRTFLTDYEDKASEANLLKYELANI